jgi:hypothetical protein
MKTKLLISCFMLLITWQSALAMRCGNELVLEGAGALEVINKCGDPQYIEESVEYRSVTIDNMQAGLYLQHETPTKVQEWSYNFGPRRFMRLLRFENGKLQTIESMGYGHK